MDLKTKNDLQTAVKNKQVALVDVDTQYDFVVKNPAPRSGLYINGAEEIMTNLEELKKVSDKNRIFKLNTMDTHTINDPEFASFSTVSDGHCVKGTKGWEKVCPDTASRHQLYVNITDETGPKSILRAVKEGEILTLEKNTYDFTKIRNAKKEIVDSKAGLSIINAIKKAGVKFAVVYGVATDICVQSAVDAFKKVGITPIVVKDAVKGIDDTVLSIPKHPIFQDVMTATTKQISEICNAANKCIKL